VTRNVCRLINEKSVPEELTFEWQVGNNLGLREMLKFAASREVEYEGRYRHALEIIANAELRNGLNQEDNEKLFKSPFADEVVHLILKGISQF